MANACPFRATPRQCVLFILFTTQMAATVTWCHNLETFVRRNNKGAEDMCLPVRVPPTAHDTDPITVRFKDGSEHRVTEFTVATYRAMT